MNKLCYLICVNFLNGLLILYKEFVLNLFIIIFYLLKFKQCFFVSFTRSDFNIYNKPKKLLVMK